MCSLLRASTILCGPRAFSEIMSFTHCVELFNLLINCWHGKSPADGAVPQAMILRFRFSDKYSSEFFNIAKNRSFPSLDA